MVSTEYDYVENLCPFANGSQLTETRIHGDLGSGYPCGLWQDAPALPLETIQVRG